MFENRVSDDFYRIHRSYLVSLKHITRISRHPLISATPNFRFQGESMTISTEHLSNITEVAYEKENIFEDS